MANSHHYGSKSILYDAKNLNLPSWKAVALKSEMFHVLIELLREPNVTLNQCIKSMIDNYSGCYVPSIQMVWCQKQ